MDEIRRANIERNISFLQNIGIRQQNENIFGSNKNKNRESNNKRSSQREEQIGQEQQSKRQSARIKQSSQKNGGYEYRCESCNNGKVFANLHGLKLHQSRSCVMSAQYKPKAFYSISDAELNKIFHVPSDSVPDNSNIIIEQTVFETEDEIGFDDMNDVKGLQEANEPISTQTTATIRQPIDSLSTLQSKFGRHLFGETFMECRSYQEFIQCVQSHYSIKQFSRKLNDHRIYNFSLEYGLSRKHGVNLLSLIRSFNPSTPVPKTIHGIENRIKMDIEKYNDLVELKVPWISKWKMNELKGFHPIKIYVRSVFEIISHMLIDPEIMLKWRQHVFLRYFKVTDADNNQVGYNRSFQAYTIFNCFREYIGFFTLNDI